MEKDTNKLFHNENFSNLWNDVILEHWVRSTASNGGLKYSMGTEKQINVCFEERLKCTKCGCLLKHHKLYEEI